MKKNKQQNNNKKKKQQQKKTKKQQTHNVAGTSLERRCNVTTLQRLCNDVVATLRVCWDGSTSLAALFSDVLVAFGNDFKKTKRSIF